MTEKRDNWSEDDLELEREFEGVSDAWRRSATPAPRVPGTLDRRIREQSRYRVGEQLKQSWILGHGPQLILAILLMFAIGVFFVISLANSTKDQEQETEAPVPKESYERANPKDR